MLNPKLSALEKWKFYTMEAVSIAGFVLVAALTTMLLEYPASPVTKTFLVHFPFFRRIILGLALGIYVGLVTLWAGKQSGAHANPVLTLAFYRLRKISFPNVCAYLAAQFLGAIIAVLLLSFFLQKYFSDPNINYSLAEPQSPHTLLSGFIAEFLITFIFVAAVLFGLSAKKLEKFMPLITGLLIMLFIVFELPYSGMSMNPARSFSGAFAANEWTDLWIYFIAPILAMVTATEVFLIIRRYVQRSVASTGTTSAQSRFWINLEIQEFPVVKQVS